MTNIGKTKLFLLAFIFGCVFCFSFNIIYSNVEKIVMDDEENKVAELLSANIGEALNDNEVEEITTEKKGEEKVFQIPAPQNCAISAESALIIEIGSIENIIFEKESSKQMPIASLTKLMTAIVANEFYKGEEKIKIPLEAIAQIEETGLLKEGDELTAKELLYIALIESSNDAAFALTQPTGQEGFVALMNLKAEEIGLNNTRFYNPTGIDEQNVNYSTTQDLAKLGKYLLAKPEILEIISKKEYRLYLESGEFHHILYNTNELLGEMPEIIAGKTGFTEKAGQCLLTITEKENQKRINIVLNSDDRFSDMRKLITCESFLNN